MQAHIPLFIPPLSISIITYNLLYPQINGKHEEPQSNPIGYRYKGKKIQENSRDRLQSACDYLLRQQADILCLQEATPDSFNTLKQKLTLYQGQFAKHPENFHGVAIFYIKERFTHLYTTKNQARSRTHLIIDLMACNLKNIRVASCHLRDPRDFEGLKKTKQIAQILEDMKPKAREYYHISAFVIAGDFNQDQWGDRPKTGKNPLKPSIPDVAHATLFYPLLRLKYNTDGNYSSSELKRMRLETGERNKSDPKYYQKQIVPRKRKIDYVWIRSETNQPIQALQPVKYAFYASDHAPVGSVFNL